ncbi:MAG TPA: carboxylating nicotinate-nucleotide diphosphorylase [Planctomycetota bacterium]|nr:carboxylating nicotinate-nucleotide diphosphorylase [Planctomycetota bacterium]
MEVVRRALQEDGAFRDLTSPIVGNVRSRGRFLAKSDLVVSGLEPAGETFRLVGARFVPRARDGQRLRRGAILATVWGPARRVLAGERTALNFLQQLSGVATLTRRFVERARPVQVFDTRKTTPGLRALEKRAVLDGGGHNHRSGLHDGVMIKDNHISAIGDLEVLRERVDELAARRVPIVIEAQTLEQALLFATFPVQVLMLDNFTVPGLRRAVRKVREVNPGIPIEASGGVNLRTVRAIARTGVDRVSVGALTHSAPAVDISLEFE